MPMLDLFQPASPALPRVRGRSGHVVVAALALLVTLSLAALLGPTDGLERYRERCTADLIPGLDTFTKRNIEMLRQGLLKLRPMRQSPASLASSAPEALALYGGPCPPPPAASLAPGLVPSSTLLPPPDPALPPGVVEVSLVCGSEELFGAERGIVTHPLLRGPDWERLSWVSARRGAEVFIESPMGLRIHGGLSRQLPTKSFAMVFRKDYGGADEAPPGLFFGPGTPAAHQLLLVGAHDSERFLGALATDIAGLMGCKTSRQIPAVVYLNGTRIPSPYFIYEHQSEAFVQQRFGLRNLDWVRLKDKASESAAAYKELDRWTRKAPAPLGLPEAGARFDLQDLCAWVLAISFTVTVDNNQGAYYRDCDNTHAAWQTLTWDMDGAFKRGFEGDAARAKMFADDPFQWVLQGLRARLFRRLVAESPEFRGYFRRFAHETLDQRLSPATLAALADRYLALAKLQPALEPHLTPALQQARTFLTSRTADFLAYVDRTMGAAEEAE